MSWHLQPVLFTLFIWWFSTGLILYLDGLPRRTFRWSWLGATAILLASIAGLALTKDNTSIGAAYCAFSCAVMIWGWQEISFLMGYITGPRVTPCPEGVSEWRRFSYALQAVLYHELALLMLGSMVTLATWSGENQVGTWTFIILWVMRQSAKLNLFLGVRNLSEEFLPEHLRYLKTYFRKRPMNLLLPISVTTSTMLAALLWRDAFVQGIGPFEAVGLSLLASLLTLAVLEHWFLVLPLPATALWSWSLRSRETRVLPGASMEAAPAGLIPVALVAKIELQPAAQVIATKERPIKTRSH